MRKENKDVRGKCDGDREHSKDVINVKVVGAN